MSGFPKRACGFCVKPFRPVTSWQKFCSKACRKADASLIEYTCEYCGIVGDTIDHVPPTSIRPTLVELRIDHYFPFVTVRCCRECNSSLGDQALWTIAARKLYIAERLKERYKPYLELPHWNIEDLNALSPALRALTVQGIGIQALTRARVERALSDEPSLRREVRLPSERPDYEPKQAKPERRPVETTCKTCGVVTEQDEYCSVTCDPNDVEVVKQHVVPTIKQVAAVTNRRLTRIERLEIEIAGLKQQQQQARSPDE